VDPSFRRGGSLPFVGATTQGGVDGTGLRDRIANQNCSLVSYPVDSAFERFEDDLSNEVLGTELVRSSITAVHGGQSKKLKDRKVFFKKTFQKIR
jgi:hypothetical protein